MLKNSFQKGLKQVSTTITIHREIPRQIKSERRKREVYERVAKFVVSKGVAGSGFAMRRDTVYSAHI